MEKMPPTRNALLQHTRRAVYQASIWATSTEAQQEVPFTSGICLRKSGKWVGSSLVDSSRAILGLSRTDKVFM